MADLSAHQIYLLIGRFHPIAVHFPIALLFVAAVTEVINLFKKRSELSYFSHLCISIAAFSAFVATILGWANADGQQFFGELAEHLKVHRWLALISTAWVLYLYLASRYRETAKQKFVFYISLLGSVCFMAIAAHFGGELVHGEDYFTEVLGKQRYSQEQLSKLKSDSEKIEITHEVSFSDEIQPILEAKCFKCHGNGKAKGDYRVDTRAMLIAGGEDGIAVKEGDPENSSFMKLIVGDEPDKVMPKKGELLSANEVALFREWIKQGVAWGEKESIGREKIGKASVTLSKVDIDKYPSHLKYENPIDVLLDPYFEANAITFPNDVSDFDYVRRVYLDLIGRLPNIKEILTFVQDPRRDKYRIYPNTLLVHDQDYAFNWLSFWNDALRNDYEGTGYVDGGREQITQWLYTALLRNKPYNEIVAELVRATPETEGFVKGIVWRGEVHANERPELQAAQNISQVFMGVNLKCASCHHSFTDSWTLQDSYGLANVYAESPLEIHKCEQPTGEFVPANFFYPELGKINPALDRDQRMASLAKIVTDPKNGRFARTIVNRVWAKFFGRGIVEPIDEMDNQPWSVELLDWLADDFIKSGYDLKHLLRTVVSSRAYRLKAVPSLEKYSDDYIFKGPHVRRLSLEQIIDSLSDLTGETPLGSAADYRRAIALSLVERFEGGLVPYKEQSLAGTQVLYRKNLAELTEAEAVELDVSNLSGLWFMTIPKSISINALGQSKAEVSASDPSEDDQEVVEESASALLQLDNLSVTNQQSTFSFKQKPILAFAGEATQSLGLGEFGAVGYKFEEPMHGKLRFAISKLNRNSEYDLVIASGVSVRASAYAATPFLTAFGRPARDQVLTRRETTATTMDALEYLKNEELLEMINAGAEQILLKNKKSDDEMLAELFLYMTGRVVTREELNLLLVNFNNKAPNSLADIIWSLLVHPEFQLLD